MDIRSYNTTAVPTIRSSKSFGTSISADWWWMQQGSLTPPLCGTLFQLTSSYGDCLNGIDLETGRGLLFSLKGKHQPGLNLIRFHPKCLAPRLSCNMAPRTATLTCITSLRNLKHVTQRNFPAYSQQAALNEPEYLKITRILDFPVNWSLRFVAHAYALRHLGLFNPVAIWSLDQRIVLETFGPLVGSRIGRLYYARKAS